MASDSISKNPEAIRAAQEAQRGEISPPAPFNAKKIFREEYEKVVDPKIDLKGADKCWDDLVSSSPHKGEILGTVEEGEYRKFCQSVAYLTQAVNLSAQSNKLHQLAESYKSVFFAEVQGRLGLQNRSNMTINIDSATIRELPEQPNPFGNLFGGQGEVVNVSEVFKELFGGRKPR